MTIPTRSHVRAVVRVPSSKSLTNRALALAALATGRSLIEAPLRAEDTTCMVRCLRALGVRVEELDMKGRGPQAATRDEGQRSAQDPQGTPHHQDEQNGHVDSALHVPFEQALAVEGKGGVFDAPAARLDVGGAGTAMRFLTALASVAQGDVAIDGNPRMRTRPIGPLLAALRDLGVDARSLDREGFPPVIVRGGTLRGGTLSIEGGISSQFVSALLMIAPLARGGSTIEVTPPIASGPYIQLTLELMHQFGVAPSGADRMTFAVPPEGSVSGLRFAFPGGSVYRAAHYRVPPDASSASYFFAAAAATGGRVIVEGLSRSDAQGDTALLAELEAMGCTVSEQDGSTCVEGPGPGSLRAFDLDLSATPDLVPTLAVLALFADGPSEIKNVANLRIKESDRLHALATELARLGARVEERTDSLRIVPSPGGYRGAHIETYDDHRIAMAFAVAGLVIPGITILDPACVAKSFPGFWRVFDQLC